MVGGREKRRDSFPREKSKFRKPPSLCGDPGTMPGKEEKRIMKRVWVPKQYFFVHLAIFAALVSAFAAAGISSYKEYVQARKAVAEGSVEDRPGFAGSGVLALSSNLATN